MKRYSARTEPTLKGHLLKRQQILFEDTLVVTVSGITLVDAWIIADCMDRAFGAGVALTEARIKGEQQ